MHVDDELRDIDEPVAAWCDPTDLHVKLRDGRIISTPIWWYPKLLHANAGVRNNVELMLSGVHWPDIDEDLSVRGMLMGLKAPGAVEPVASAA